jgi:hypothetical protein
MAHEALHGYFHNIRQDENRNHQNCKLQLFPLQSVAHVQHEENLRRNQRKIVGEIQQKRKAVDVIEIVNTGANFLIDSSEF